MNQPVRRRTAAPRNSIHWQGIRQILDHGWHAGADSGGRMTDSNKETAR